MYPELLPTLPPEFQDYLFSILAQNTFLLDEFIKNANPKKQEELAAVESVLSSLVSALSRYRGDQPGFVKASDAMIQNLLPMLLNLSSSEGPLSQIASKQLNRIVCLPWIAKQILLASGPSAESAEIESWARGLVKSEQWKRLVELVKEQNLTDKNRDLAAPIAIEVASNPKLYEQQVHKAAVKRLLNEQVSKGRDISNEFLKDYLDFYRAVAGSPDSKQYSPKVQNVVRKNFIRLLLLRSNSQYNRESIEEDIKLYGKFLLENVNFEQRSSFIDIVHNLYFPKEGQPKIPKDVAQVIADSSVGKFADDSQMSKKYTEEYIRKHQKYSEHVRLEALYQAPKAPDWLNDESAKSFLQTLESNPDRLSSHQLAEYFVYLSKQSNPADGYSALFRQLALAQNKTVVTLFRNYLAKYEGLSFNTPQNIADLKMALIANSNFRMLREITRVNLIKSVPLPYLKATLDTHRTGAGGAPDDFYKKLSESLLNNYPDIISQLSPENQQAIQAIRDKAPVPQPAAIVEAPKPQQVRLAEVAPGESEESRLRAHFSQLLTKYNAEYIKNLDPLRKNPLGKLFQVSAKHWPLAKKLQERINEILKKVNSEQTPAEALPALLPALWREFNTEISNYKDELVKGNSKRYLHELSTFQNREDIRIKKLELEDVFNRGAYQLAAGAGAGAGARARAAEEGHGSSSSPRP